MIGKRGDINVMLGQAVLLPNIQHRFFGDVVFFLQNFRKNHVDLDLPDN